MEELVAKEASSPSGREGLLDRFALAGLYESDAESVGMMTIVVKNGQFGCFVPKNSRFLWLNLFSEVFETLRSDLRPKAIE